MLTTSADGSKWEVVNIDEARKETPKVLKKKYTKGKGKETKWDSTDIMHIIVVNKLLIKINQLLS